MKVPIILEDLDYSDDISLLSSRHKDIKRGAATSFRTQGTLDSASTTPSEDKGFYKQMPRLLKQFQLMDYKLKT